ncbi:exonuclease SbcCD subunit D [Anaerosphaera multitolerans]|uniref:Nuclease SbcCD subunit D n=1 Tax=Anaerosphaera multitolerans TaxID=2487351 RepID=A0A437S4T3_9FIRM|nr:exonuclease SbcCD subunit D [Anaerosphaera multitolerans]RVU54004.1 exonuclease SbcCD subunit D [Anaerosphaera multitolerans]
MKIFHIADLHIGKVVNGFSMLEDQKHILEQILRKIDKEKPDVLLVAGDIYDKTVPSGAAVSLFDEFLTALSQKDVIVICISGNHDSPERIGFGSRIMKNSDIYISGVFEGDMRKVTVEDDYGEVDFYLLPFVKPMNVRRFFPEEEIESYSDGLAVIFKNQEIDFQRRNILVAHQFVLPSSGEVIRSDSETEPVGGINGIYSDVFNGFDYVALGHLHGSQKIGRDCIRYAGSPLKYSFSEVNHNKSVTVFELREKGDYSISEIPLNPKCDMRKIRGPLKELISEEVLSEGNPRDYMHITLTDEGEILDAIGILRSYYPNVMELSFDNSRTRYDSQIFEIENIEQKSTMELFETFYREQNGSDLTESHKQIIEKFFKDMEERI